MSTAIIVGGESQYLGYVVELVDSMLFESDLGLTTIWMTSPALPHPQSGAPIWWQQAHLSVLPPAAELLQQDAALSPELLI